MARIFLLFVLSLFCIFSGASELEYLDDVPHHNGIFTDVWVVHFTGSELDNQSRPSDSHFAHLADELALRKNLVNLGQVGQLSGVYSFKHKACAAGAICRRDAVELTEDLKMEDEVREATQQIGKRRYRRRLQSWNPTFNDPGFPSQWHLNNVGGHDVNVFPVWEMGITGKGVTVSILDDGLEHDHADLQKNYRPAASYDFNENDPDPMPRYTPSNINNHGTRCAGEVSAEPNNNYCGAGVAYDAGIGGIKLIDGDVTDSMEASSLGYAPQVIDIYSNSWGPNDDGVTVEGPGPLTRRTLETGVAVGRNGLGSIYVFASGNGGRKWDNCNCDGYTNSIYTISIGSVTDQGTSPWYTEPCAATVAVTTSSGGSGNRDITSTDLNHVCTDHHTGTSAAAPIAAGLFALMLEANPKLTWRDVQHIVVLTAKKFDDNDSDWAVNGIGRPVNHKYGFGELDAELMVKSAQTWTNVGPWVQCKSGTMMQAGRWKIARTARVTFAAGSCPGGGGPVAKLEHVTVTVDISHPMRGGLSVVLTSPSGTRSELLTERKYDYSSEGFQDWTFMTVRNWGESPEGEWVLEVNDNTDRFNPGTLNYWELTFYGTGPEDPPAPTTTAPPTTAPSTSDVITSSEATPSSSEPATSSLESSSAPSSSSSTRSSSTVAVSTQTSETTSLIPSSPAPTTPSTSQQATGSNQPVTTEPGISDPISDDQVELDEDGVSSLLSSSRGIALVMLISVSLIAVAVIIALVIFIRRRNAPSNDGFQKLELENVSEKEMYIDSESDDEGTYVPLTAVTHHADDV
eukprot:Colp12_sorted_trinity150504_noHs@30087